MIRKQHDIILRSLIPSCLFHIDLLVHLEMVTTISQQLMQKQYATQNHERVYLFQVW